MRTRLFCELVELAISEQYGEESNFDTVPYIGDDGGVMRECLGVFLLDGVHMAVVAAKAQYILYRRMADEGAEDADIDEALGDFADIMGGMHVAPYMQWHCAYFPGLTAEQVLAESESTEDPNEAVAAEAQRVTPVDTRTDPIDGSFVAIIDPLFDEVTKEIEAMRAVGEISQEDYENGIAWCQKHTDDLRPYRDGGMKISEIADTVLSLARI